MFTNRHVVVALIVAPVLSVAGWWAAGEFAGEQPQPARPGQSYPLLEKSNCRYASGICDLENADLKLSVQYTRGAVGNALVVRSSHRLEAVLVSVAPADEDAHPTLMDARDDVGKHWSLPLAGRPDERARIRLVARASGSTYFGDAGTAFLHPQLSGGPAP